MMATYLRRAKIAPDLVICSTAMRQLVDSDSVNLGSNPVCSNRCVFVVSSVAGIVLNFPRVSFPANASATTRDAKCLFPSLEALQAYASTITLSTIFDAGTVHN
jgi:hypothetical protein